jgi:hypothetical protein
MNRDQDNPKHDQAEVASLRNISAVALAALGTGQMAFIKPVVIDGKRVFAVHGADGTALAVVEDHDVAFALVRQNDLEPLSVH